MIKRNSLISAIVIALAMALLAIPAFSQSNPPPGPGNESAQNQPAQPPAVKEEAPQPKEIAIYGEVQAANTAAGSITVQYYDYDSDEEKTIEVTSDKDTKVENAGTIGDIKKGDWADITYIAAEGKNIAKSIIVEKEEQSTEPEMTTESTTE